MQYLMLLTISSLPRIHLPPALRFSGHSTLHTVTRYAQLPFPDSDVLTSYGNFLSKPRYLASHLHQTRDFTSRLQMASCAFARLANLYDTNLVFISV